MPALRLLITVCLFLAVTLHAASARAAEPIEVIAAFNLTGSEAVLDGPSYNGAVLAVEEINEKGGVLGRPLELVPVDTESLTPTAAEAARAALEQHPKVVAGIGFSYSTYALSVGRVFQAADLPFITSGATAPDLPQRVGDDFFMAAYGDDAQARVMATFAREHLGLDHVAVWTDESRIYPRTIAIFFDEAFRAIGGRVEQTTYSLGTTDFGPLIEAFKAADPRPQAIYSASVPQEAAMIIEQVREAGIEVPLLSGDGWANPDLYAASKKHGIEDLFFTTHRFLGVETPAMQAFIAAYKTRFGEAPPNAFAPLGYDTVMLLADAIARADSDEPAEIREALDRTRRFEGLVGTIDYAPGNRVPDKAVEVVEISKGNLTPVGTWMPSLQ